MNRHGLGCWVLGQMNNNNNKSLANWLTLTWRSSELSFAIYRESKTGNTFATATARACSGVCLPICPKDQAAAALMWSSGSSDKHTASCGTPCGVNQKHKTLWIQARFYETHRDVQEKKHFEYHPVSSLGGLLHFIGSFQQFASFSARFKWLFHSFSNSFPLISISNIQFAAF